jgi:peptidoglycan/LPS O-acetylase OafA/YrhL
MAAPRTGHHASDADQTISPEVTRASSRIPSLDGLRAISIMMVIVAHFSGGVWKPDSFGAFGVQVFFVISGFLITSLLQDEQCRLGRISLSAFYRRRAFRILPAAYFFILLVAAVLPASRQYLS